MGGIDALRTAVDMFYVKIFADPELVGFFKNSDMAQLQKKQVVSPGCLPPAVLPSMCLTLRISSRSVCHNFKQ